MKTTGEKQQAIRERLIELEKLGGGILTPEAVVDDATNPGSVLHDAFQWDDVKAAYAFRIDQARALIKSVLYVSISEHTTVRAPYYQRNPSASGNEPGYVSIPTLRSDEDMARAALVDAFRSVGDMLRRAQQLAVVLDLDTEIAQLLNGVMELRNRIADEPRQMM